MPPLVTRSRARAVVAAGTTIDVADVAIPGAAGAGEALNRCCYVPCFDCEYCSGGFGCHAHRFLGHVAHCARREGPLVMEM